MPASRMASKSAAPQLRRGRHQEGQGDPLLGVLHVQQPADRQRQQGVSSVQQNAVYLQSLDRPGLSPGQVECRWR